MNENEQITRMPVHLKRILQQCFWILLVIVVIKIFKIDYLGFPEKKIPNYLLWLNVSKILLFYILFQVYRYGWTKLDRSMNLSEHELMVIKIFEGIARITFVILAVFSLKILYFVFIALTFPSFWEYRLVPWILFWLFFLFLCFRKDKFIGTLKELSNDPKIREFMINFLANIVLFIRNKWTTSSTLAKFIFFGVILVLLYYFFS